MSRNSKKKGKHTYNNSTNHTYLNGSQVYSNMDVVIPDNSIIKLSNEEFVYKNM